MSLYTSLKEQQPVNIVRGSVSSHFQIGDFLVVSKPFCSIRYEYKARTVRYLHVTETSNGPERESRNELWAQAKAIVWSHPRVHAGIYSSTNQWKGSWRTARPRASSWLVPQTRRAAPMAATLALARPPVSARPRRPAAGWSAAPRSAPSTLRTRRCERGWRPRPGHGERRSSRNRRRERCARLLSPHPPHPDVCAIARPQHIGRPQHRAP